MNDTKDMKFSFEKVFKIGKLLAVQHCAVLYFHDKLRACCDTTSVPTCKKTIDINTSGLPARMFFALKLALPIECHKRYRILTNFD